MTVTADTGGHSKMKTHVRTCTPLLSHPDDSKIWQEYQNCCLLGSHAIRFHKRPQTLGWICCFRLQGTRVLSLSWKQHDLPVLCNKTADNRLTTLSHSPHQFQAISTLQDYELSERTLQEQRVDDDDYGVTVIGGTRSTRTDTCPSATMSTTDLTLTTPWSNQGLRGERPEMIRLSHGRPF